jgi:uncharacterized Zn finger protein
MIESAYTVRGNPLHCSVCGSESFEQSYMRSKDNAFLWHKPSFLRTRPIPVVLVCADCGFVHLFQPGGAGPEVVD